MKKLVILILVMSLQQLALSQTWLGRKFPTTVITAQYGGSTGFLSFGLSKATAHHKFEIGLLYGNVPKSMGGVNNSITIKTTVNPFRIHAFKHILVEPLQTGLFMSRNFGEHLGPNWSSNYPNGYYWWTRSIRFHFFIGTQVSYKIEKKHIDRISAYFEANTNDLYLYSYFPNRNTIRLYDIFFFGTGIKLYIR